MTEANQRELAQLVQRDTDEAHAETALMLVEVAGRDHMGRVNQYRKMREATAEELAAHPEIMRGAVADALLSLKMLQEGQWLNEQAPAAHA